MVAMELLQTVFDSADLQRWLLLISCAVLATIKIYQSFKEDNGWSGSKKIKRPPSIPSSIPFFGHAYTYGKDPKAFLLDAYKKYGPVFRFKMMGEFYTFFVGPEPTQELYHSKNEDLNAEELYGLMTTPIFGKGVAYDVPHAVMLEQFGFVRKSGLTRSKFPNYVSIIEAETKEYMRKNWKDTGKIDILDTLREINVRAGTRCMLGDDVADAVSLSVYQDLKSGFHPAAVSLPTWLTSTFIFQKRDKARQEMRKAFYKLVEERKTNPKDDSLQGFFGRFYKNGTEVSDDEIVGMMMAIMTLGIEEPSITSCWLALYLAKHQDVQEQCYQEQLDYSEDKLTFRTLDNFQVLERCIKETLRLTPPAFTFARRCKNYKEISGYQLIPGDKCCISVTANQALEEIWGEDASEFNPERFSNLNEERKNSYTPFGAGTHKCLGSHFAMMQIKTIWSTILKEYELHLVDGVLPEEDRRTLFLTPIDASLVYKKRV